MEKNNVVVIYHANCTDGFGAAYSAWKKFKDDAIYIPMDHGGTYTIPEVVDKDVYILDFSYPKDLYLEILSQAKTVTLIDHHQTAYENLKDCCGCHFDLSKSGAHLAWLFFHPTLPTPRFINYIEDADILKFEFEDTKHFYHGLHTLAYDFEQWEQLENEEFLNELIVKGKGIHEFYLFQLEHILKDAKPVYLNGVAGLMINTNTLFASDIGFILAQRSGTFALVWNERSNMVKCSLRSVKGFDCSVIARRFGGGGQERASAFTVASVSLFYRIIQDEQRFKKLFAA